MTTTTTTTVTIEKFSRGEGRDGLNVTIGSSTAPGRFDSDQHDDENEFPSQANLHVCREMADWFRAHNPAMWESLRAQLAAHPEIARVGLARWRGEITFTVVTGSGATMPQIAEAIYGFAPNDQMLSEIGKAPVPTSWEGCVRETLRLGGPSSLCDERGWCFDRARAVRFIHLAAMRGEDITPLLAKAKELSLRRMPTMHGHRAEWPEKPAI